MKNRFVWLTVGLLVAFSLLCLFLKSIWPDIARENGPMENFQALCIIAGTGFCVAALAKSSGRAQRVFAFGVALLFLTMFVLEVDTRKSGVPILVVLFNGTVRNVWLGLAWLGGAVVFFRNKNPVWNVFVAWLRSRSGGLLLAAAVFWLLGRISDKALLGSKDLFLEELMEINAGLLMALGAYWLWRWSAPRQEAPSSLPS